MNKNAIVRIVIWCIVILVLVSILIAGMNFRGYLFRRSVSSSTAETYVPQRIDGTGEGASVSAEGIRDICVDWAAGTITVTPGDVEEITFTESALSDSKYQMVWSQSGSKLNIQFCRDAVSFGVHLGESIKKDLVITVPRDWHGDSLEVNAASARLYAQDLTLREVELDTASGKCQFENCAVGSLDIDTASGDVDFTGSLTELDCDAASASFRGVLSNVPSRMSMDSMSGDLDITLPEDAGFTVDMDAMSSKFSSDFPTTSKNGSHICGDGRCRISVSAMSGDVLIRKSAHSASGSCTEPGCTDPSHEHEAEKHGTLDLHGNGHE